MEYKQQLLERIANRDAPVLVYCAGGVRSAFAAKTLQELGYSNVVSMAGGFGKWKNEGREWRVPAALSAEQRNRYQRHLLLPEVGEIGQQKLLDAKVLLLGAGAGAFALAVAPGCPAGHLAVLELDVTFADGRHDEPALPREPSFVLVEAPHPRFAAMLRHVGDDVQVVYDAIDVWDGTLGAGWYEASAESAVRERANALYRLFSIIHLPHRCPRERKICPQPSIIWVSL